MNEGHLVSSSFKNDKYVSTIGWVIKWKFYSIVVMVVVEAKW